MGFLLRRLPIVLFIFGLIIGSFLTLAIYQLFNSNFFYSFTNNTNSDIQLPLLNDIKENHAQPLMKYEHEHGMIFFFKYEFL